MAFVYGMIVVQKSSDKECLVDNKGVLSTRVVVQAHSASFSCRTVLEAGALVDVNLFFGRSSTATVRFASMNPRHAIDPTYTSLLSKCELPNRCSLERLITSAVENASSAICILCGLFMGKKERSTTQEIEIQKCERELNSRHITDQRVMVWYDTDLSTSICGI